MKKAVVMLVGILLAGSTAWAQPVRLLQTEGNEENQGIHAAVRVSDGVVMAGYTVSSLTPDSGKDILLKKVDESGQVLWEQAVGGTNDEEAFAITETANHDLVITGYTHSSHTSQENLLVSRFRDDGTHPTHLWTQVMYHGDDTLQFRGSAVIEDSAGDIIITGRMDRTNLFVDRDSVLLVKYSSDGLTVRFKESFYRVGMDHYGESLIETPDDDYLIFGWWKDTDENALIVEVGRLGVFHWGWNLGDDGVDDRGNAVVLADDDSFAALVGQTGSDMFVAMGEWVPPSDEFEIPWRRRGSSAWGLSVAVNNEGIVTTGKTTGFNPDVFLAKWDLDGNQSWSHRFGGVGTDEGRSVMIDDGGFWVAGFTNSQFWSAGGYDVLLVRTCADGLPCGWHSSGPDSLDWTPEVSESNPLLTEAFSAFSDGWTPTMVDPSFTTEVICVEGACCTYAMGECIDVWEWEPGQCDGWMVRECLGDRNWNAIDDECELIHGLEVSRAYLTWDAHIVAEKYDVVMGDLLGLHETGDFNGNVVACLADDHETTMLPWDVDPDPGAGFWVLVRGVWTIDEDSVSMTYGNTERDVGIKADPDDCED